MVYYPRGNLTIGAYFEIGRVSLAVRSLIGWNRTFCKVAKISFKIRHGHAATYLQHGIKVMAAQRGKVLFVSYVKYIVAGRIKIYCKFSCNPTER